MRKNRLQIDETQAKKDCSEYHLLSYNNKVRIFIRALNAFLFKNFVNTLNEKRNHFLNELQIDTHLVIKYQEFKMNGFGQEKSIQTIKPEMITDPVLREKVIRIQMTENDFFDLEHYLNQKGFDEDTKEKYLEEFCSLVEEEEDIIKNQTILENFFNQIRDGYLNHVGKDNIRECHYFIMHNLLKIMSPNEEFKKSLLRECNLEIHESNSKMKEEVLNLDLLSLPFVNVDELEALKKMIKVNYNLQKMLI